MKILSEKWLLDTNNLGEGHVLEIEKIVTKRQTKFQSAAIVKFRSYGLSLVLDGKIQSAERDEFIFHEALVHPPMVFHPNPKSVIVIGGGEGATIREVLKHKSVEKVVMVDIDGEVIELCKEHLKTFHQGSFFDKRVEIIIDDGREYIKRTKDKFDVAICDLSEPLENSPAFKLFTVEFYKELFAKLTPLGVISAQSGSTTPCELPNYAILHKTLSTVFSSTIPYLSYMADYGSLWGFLIGSKERLQFDPKKINIDKLIEQKINGELKFYDGESHIGMFNIPKHIRTNLLSANKIFEDKNPLLL